MRFFTSTARTAEVKALDTEKGASARWLATTRRRALPGMPLTDAQTTERVVADGLERDVWTFKAAHAIGVSGSDIPIVKRRGDFWKGEIVDDDDPIVSLLNGIANEIEDGPAFRYRSLVSLIVSRRGIFIERKRTRTGRLLGLHMLPHDLTSPVPGKDAAGNPTLLSHYEVRLPDGGKAEIPPDDVVWIRWPHPTDPWGALSPIQALGLSIDMSHYARLYNRTFLAKDGRPGGILSIQGRMLPAEMEELRRRMANPSNAGETSVVEANDMTYVDLGVRPRDMNYKAMRDAAKEEILVGVGTPETVAGNASGRTFDNADAEEAIFWRITMKPILGLFARGLQKWTNGGVNDGMTLGYDLSGIAVLQRDEQAEAEFALTEYEKNAITLTEYRDVRGRKPLSEDEKGDLAVAIAGGGGEPAPGDPAAAGGAPAASDAAPPADQQPAPADATPSTEGKAARLADEIKSLDPGEMIALFEALDIEPAPEPTLEDDERWVGVE